MRCLLSPSQRVEGSLNEKRQHKHADDESVHRSLVFFRVSEEDIWTAMRARQRGSGSGEAAHPSPSLRIRTICTGALERVILSMQSRCHAVSVGYASAESANLHPHRFTKKNTRTHRTPRGLTHLCEIWALTLSFQTLWTQPQRGMTDIIQPFSIIKRCCESALKSLF